jgi:mRNA interferase RelE/StbE
MSFRLLYHPQVAASDLPPIDRRIRKQLGKAILGRLSTSPESYGRPLRGSLKGFWKLRFGDLRVIYRVVGKEVWVLSIKNRRGVYSELNSRLGWKP